jgi:hypothetical protein
LRLTGGPFTKGGCSSLEVPQLTHGPFAKGGYGSLGGGVIFKLVGEGVFAKSWRGSLRVEPYRKNYTKNRSLTDKKDNQVFLIYKEIQSGAVAKSYMSI